MHVRDCLFFNMINEFNCFLKRATIKIAALILLLEQHVVLVQIFLADLILVYWVPRNEGLRA
ncbi:UNVERIFIED_CONTAM: hypothetical protein DV032_15400 [Lacticaseibacillus paracasei]|nr:hypothetical protein [Lacticaseibacillus paracasei]